MASDRDMAEQILGCSVNDFISLRLQSGMSWSDIGSDLYIATGGQVDVSVFTLRRWANSPKAPLEQDTMKHENS